MQFAFVIYFSSHTADCLLLRLFVIEAIASLVSSLPLQLFSYFRLGT